MAALLAAKRVGAVLPVELWELVLSMTSAALWRAGAHRVDVLFRWQRNNGTLLGLGIEEGVTVVRARPCRSWAWVLAAMRRASGPAFIRSIELVGFPYQSRRYCNGSRRALVDGQWRALDFAWPLSSVASQRIAASQEQWIVGDSLRPLTARETEAANYVMAEIELEPGVTELFDLPRTMRPDLIVSNVERRLPAWMRSYDLFVVHRGTAVDRLTAIGATSLVDGGELEVWAMAPPGKLLLRRGAEKQVIRTDVGYDVDTVNIVHLAPPP